MPISDEVLSEEKLASIMAPISEALTLPKEAFISQEFYQAEVENIFSKRWTGVLFELDVPEPGSVYPFEMCGMPLLAVRGPDRIVRVFHNVVSYDGCLAALEANSGLNEIVTPYHGWVYDLYGQLTAIPFWDGTRETSLESVRGHETKLVEVATETAMHTVFINLSAEPEPFTDFIAPLKRQYPDHDFENLTPMVDAQGDTICTQTKVECNWKTYFENACINVLHEGFVHDLYKRSPLHPRVNDAGVKTYFEVIDNGLLGFGFQHSAFTQTYGEPNPKVKHVGRGKNPPETSSFSTLYPNFYITNMPYMIDVGIALPQGAERTIERRIILMEKKSAASLESPFGNGPPEGIADPSDEDAIICMAIQKARQSPVYSQHFYSPFWDALHYEFSKLVALDVTRRGSGNA